MSGISINKEKKPLGIILDHLLTYDRGGFDGLHHLLQRLQMRMVMSKLCLLVIHVASSLQKQNSFELISEWDLIKENRRSRSTFTMRPLESTIQILLAASSGLTPSLAIAMMSRCAIPRAAW